jgi:hypothetical protein
MIEEMNPRELCMVVAEPAEIGVEQVRAGGWEGVEGKEYGTHSVGNGPWQQCYPISSESVRRSRGRTGGCRRGGSVSRQ